MNRFYRVALALVAATALAAGIPQRSDAAFVSFGISVNFGPPALPVYVQPPAPFVNAIWQPGYWAWGPNGYYWVPGTWVAAPAFGYLWTPGYWGYDNVDAYYHWHPGYWATRIGFYGGINYGFGYFGRGFVGGGWYGHVFRYNTAVVNVNRTVIRNVYVDRTVINNYNTNVNVTRVSYNGGNGVRAVPTSDERAVMQEHHLGLTSEQRANLQVASQNRNYLASVNRGRPLDAAATRPLSVDNHPQTFAAIRPEDRAGATTMNAPHTQYHPQLQYRPQNQYRPQSQARTQTQARPQRPPGRQQARPRPEPRVTHRPA